MNKLPLLIAAGLVAAAAPVAAQETLTVPFTQADGAVTTGLYAGQVRITVSGTGQSDGTIFNDAFYLLPGGLLATGGAGYYQLAFSTSTLLGSNQNDAAYRYISTGRPAYDQTHSYTFLLNTGLTTPGQLHFGVSDGRFSDNTGAYTLTVSGVPEPATWAAMVVGLGAVGVALRRRSGARVSHA